LSSPLLLLLSDKCHSSLSLAATIGDLFRIARGAERGRERGLREGQRHEKKEKNGCFLTCASEKQKNKAAVTKARVLFSSLFSLLGVFVKGTVVLSAYLYILFRKLL